MKPMLIEEEGRFREACEKAARLILEHGGNYVDKLKLAGSREFRLSSVASNREILENARGELKDSLRKILVKKPVKTISGVSVITVVVPMLSCPHGSCIYCPGGSDAPKSYTGEEEAIKSASLFDYDPFMQVKNQMGRLEKMGHQVDKVELIFIAGTFSALPWGYQKWFIKRCLDALNG
ncbi:MAG: tRNA uridine(34) 5-carboxymethylaminomethyl modification radical SAM/GNAT enzyme Elp3, partial [Thaumarchaeota archaeon]